MLIPILMSLFSLAKIYFSYPSFYIFQLVISSFLFFLWTFLAIPLYFYNVSFSSADLILIENIGTIFGSIAALFFVFVMIDTYSSGIVIIPRITVFGFSMVVGAKLIQLTLPSGATIYGLKVVNGELVRVGSIISQLIIFIAFFGFVITQLLFSYNQFALPDWILPHHLKKYLIYSILLIDSGIIMNFVGTFVNDFLTSGIILILSRFLITSGFLFSAFQFSQNPILNFSEKGNPVKYLQNGLIGWIAVANKDRGPEIMSNSAEFLSHYSLDISNMSLLAVKLITSVSLGSEDFKEDLVIVPFNIKEFSLTAIGSSFKAKDPTNNDLRKGGFSDVVFALILPNILIQFFENINNKEIKKLIDQYLTSSVELSEFISKTPFQELSLKIMRNLSSKRIF